MLRLFVGPIGFTFGFLLLRYSVLFTVESFSLLKLSPCYILIVSTPDLCTLTYFYSVE